MTIHKSKGLEFPVVICPYADMDIYQTIDPKVWLKLDKKKYNGFSHTLINLNKDLEMFGDQGIEIYNKHKANLELDSINLLYVALTRAIEQLFVISKKDISEKGMVSPQSLFGFVH